AERPAEEQQLGAVQQPERAAPARQAAHLLRRRARQHRQPGQRLGRRAQRLPPPAAGQGGRPGGQRLHRHPAQAVFARGIAAASGRFICVGTSSGLVLVFDIPSKGTNITLSEVLQEHHDSITDIASEVGENPDGAADLVTADDSGALCVWRSKEEFSLLTKISAFGWTCSSVKLWNGVIAAGYGNGQIRLYEATSGALRATVSAHARWIYALDLAPLTGKLLSGAEDSYVQIWKLSRSPDTGDIEIEHCHSECVTDTQLCGARFCDPEGNSFAATGYDLSEIVRYGQV
uniref:WD repeat domain 54 n=1 Tax=Chrysemys picta bellii TaxID=8478 RepID=A0A8C3IJR7_CHRPI